MTDLPPEVRAEAARAAEPERKFYTVKSCGFEYKIECDDCDLEAVAGNPVRLLDIINGHLAHPATDTHVVRVDKK